MKKNLLKTLPETLLILLYVYAAISKILDFNNFRGQLYNQTFPHELAAVLLYALPATELLAVALLVGSKTRMYGLGLSLWLLTLFTGYISLVLFHFWNRVPCSCGGILNHMGWTTHLFFNLFFIILNLIAIRIKPTGDAENLEQSRHYPIT